MLFDLACHWRHVFLDFVGEAHGLIHLRPYDLSSKILLLSTGTHSGALNGNEITSAYLRKMIIQMVNSSKNAMKSVIEKLIDK